jgi:hypothetical protein
MLATRQRSACPWEHTCRSASWKSPAFYGTWRYITGFTRGCYWTLYQTIKIQTTSSPPVYLRPVLILSSHLCVIVTSHFFPSDFLTKYYMHVSCPHVTCPDYLILLHLFATIIRVFWTEYTLRNSSHPLLGQSVAASYYYISVKQLNISLP